MSGKRLEIDATHLNARLVTSAHGLRSMSLRPGCLSARFSLFCALLCTLLGSHGVRAADLLNGITLTLDTTTTYLGDSVTLDVESTGLIEDADVTPLFRNAELLRETVGTRIAVVKGKVVEVKLRHMELLPRREGLIILGPITGESVSGPVTSNSVALTVGPPVDRRWTPTDDDVALSFTLSRDAPVIGELIIADIVLRHRHAIADERIRLPTFKGFDVLEVYQARRTLDPPEGDDSSGWRRVAWRYLLWPRRSGHIDVEGVQWSGNMIRSRSQRGDFERSIAPRRLDVAAASSATGTWWLPASNVSLESDWSEDVKGLSAGDQIIRTITLTATDVQASALPDVVPLESRALSSSRIDVKRSQQLVGDTLTATAVFRFRLTAQSPIPVFLDTVRVDWWNTRTRESREAIIPARRINVGLPDREDLLADLASSQHWWERTWLSLQSLPLSQPLMWISLTLLTVLLLVLLWLPRRERGKPTSALPSL